MIVTIGVFGIAEIISYLIGERKEKVEIAKVERLMPTRKDLREMTPPILRGTILGSFLGILPAAAPCWGLPTPMCLRRRSRAIPRSLGRGLLRALLVPSRQQCRCANLVHSDADAGYPVQSGDRADDWRPDHARDPTGPRCHHRAAGAVLGHRRFDVARQPDASGAEPATDQDLGCD